MNKNIDDHDLLIELRTLMNIVTVDIKNLTNNLSQNVNTLGERMRDVEKSASNFKIYIGIAILVICALFGLYASHIFKTG